MSIADRYSSDDIVDHDSIDGLSGDDHTQHVLADGKIDITGNQTVNGSLIVDNISMNGSSIGTNIGSDFYLKRDGDSKLSCRS